MHHLGRCVMLERVVAEVFIRFVIKWYVDLGRR